MNFPEFSALELSWIRQELDDPTIEIFLQENWGSQNENYREFLHTDLKLRGASVDSSISHTEGLGGYVFTQKLNSKIGLDIEVVSRVRAEVAKRICQDVTEYTNAPSSASLWAAKEAAFKALKGPKQPQVVSEIIIGQWRIHDSQYETCRLENLQNLEKSVAKGIVLQKSGFVFSFFSVLP